MTDRELNIALREMAREKGLCDEWYGEWKDTDTVDMCLDRFVRGFDFVQSNDYPPLGFIRENFRKDDLHRHHIYLDEEVDIEAPESGYYIFLGSCTGRLIVKGFLAVTVYLRHNSDILVSSEDGARVFVTAYDYSTAICQDKDFGTLHFIDRSNK